MTKACAECIYCGMMTDTGGFTYNSTRPEIFSIISLLLQKGIDKEIIAQVVEELEPNPAEKIKEIIEKKYLRCLQDEKGYRRAVNGLQRLGYRYEDIRQAISCFSLEADEDIYYE